MARRLFVMARRPFVIERRPFVTTERLFAIAHRRFVIAHRRFVIADLIRNPVPADTGCRVEPGMTSWRSGMTSCATACGLAMTGRWTFIGTL
jgi:hypothetical protein